LDNRTNQKRGIQKLDINTFIVAVLDPRVCIAEGVVRCFRLSRGLSVVGHFQVLSESRKNSFIA
jgi:hypothetical protein